MLFFIDLFCGAGGTSTGVEAARVNGEKCAKVIACVNHDANAIASHAANHPDALHFVEDIRTLDTAPLVKHLQECIDQSVDRPTVVLWASLECTNFSRAKGGLPRDADSRTLAEHLFRYIDAIKPDYVMIENVEEFMWWGGLDADGHPIKEERGKLYRQWVDHVCRYGYRFDYRILNSADFGAYTTRKRFFCIFAHGDLPIVFPQPTHSKSGNPPLQKWNAVREVLDMDDVGDSIFGRKKPLVDRTLERIYAGLVKFVSGGKEQFEADREHFLCKHYSGHPDSKNLSVNGPAGTITTVDHHAFLTAYYGNGHNHSVNAPSPTLTTKDRLAFVDMQYGNGTPSDKRLPAPTVTTNPKHQLVFIRRRQFLVNPQYSSSGASVDKPSFTLIARMDKRPPSIVSAEEGIAEIAIQAGDTPAMIKIKEFMRIYGIVDIKMRMLRVHELKRIMGFPSNYILVGTIADQKKFIGNAVETNTACAMTVSLWMALQQYAKDAI
ncbi:DNA cytosine methyltransferase [Porphyromonas loveana]|uniref:DNA cytosine methyltransferase n=1 Tax=Porphyromonas loveana TaxID=1884669 RepID=UPI0035A0DB3C